MPLPSSIQHEPGDELMIWKPPFYERGKLLRVGPHDGAKRFYAVVGDNYETVVRLNGTSDAIHAANRAAGLVIDEGTVIDYLKFFCAFLDGPDDRFNVVGTPDVVAANDNGFQCTALVRYDGAMFNALFAVHRSGDTAMLEDWPLGRVE